MTLSPEKVADLRMKHLEMTQAIITRMANYSAALKNYCLTLTTAIVGFAISMKLPWVLTAGFFPIIVFATLDAQYLRLERRFRMLYNEIRLQDWKTMPDFEINLDKIPKVSFLEVFFSWSIGNFYLPIAIGLAIVLGIALIVYRSV